MCLEGEIAFWVTMTVGRCCREEEILYLTQFSGYKCIKYLVVLFSVLHTESEKDGGTEDVPEEGFDSENIFNKFTGKLCDLVSKLPQYVRICVRN